MNNAISTLNLLPSTLDQVARFVSKAKDEILSGEYNVLSVLVQLRAAQQAFDILNKDDEVIEAASKEYAKYGLKTVELGNAKIVQREVGVKYEFESSCDPEWERLQSAEKFAAEGRKARETFLKTLNSPMTMIDEQSGEVVTINPVPKTSKTTLAITLK
jgi:hypothetical protein